MNFFGYVGLVTIGLLISGMLTTACCLIVGLAFGLGLGLDSVSGWLVVIAPFFCNFPL